MTAPAILPKEKDDVYTRMVRVFRVAFPLAALILVGSIFVLSRSQNLREGLIIADGEMAVLAIGQKVTNPHFSGVTSTGDAFTITAEWALPDAPRPEIIDLNRPITTVDFLDGRSLQSRSTTGQLNLTKNQAVLSGEVRFQTSDGYDAKSDMLVINFETGNVTSPGPVSATGPLGSIDSGAMELRQNLRRNPLGGRGVLLFKSGVKVVYRPPIEQK